jgi:hypothetical protein
VTAEVRQQRIQLREVALSEPPPTASGHHLAESGLDRVSDAIGAELGRSLAQQLGIEVEADAVSHGRHDAASRRLRVSTVPKRGGGP